MMVDPNPLGRKLKDKSLPQPPKNKAYANTLHDNMSAIGNPDASKESYKAPANGGDVNEALRYANVVGNWRATKADMRDKLHQASVGDLIRKSPRDK